MDSPATLPCGQVRVGNLAWDRHQDDRTDSGRTGDNIMPLSQATAYGGITNIHTNVLQRYPLVTSEWSTVPMKKNSQLFLIKCKFLGIFTVPARVCSRGRRTLRA